MIGLCIFCCSVSHFASGSFASTCNPVYLVGGVVEDLKERPAWPEARGRKTPFFFSFALTLSVSSAKAEVVNLSIGWPADLGSQSVSKQFREEDNSFIFSNHGRVSTMSPRRFWRTLVRVSVVNDVFVYMAASHTVFIKRSVNNNCNCGLPSCGAQRE